MAPYLHKFSAVENFFWMISTSSHPVLKFCVRPCSYCINHRSCNIIYCLNLSIKSSIHSITLRRPAQTKSNDHACVYGFQLISSLQPKQLLIISILCQHKLNSIKSNVIMCFILTPFLSLPSQPLLPSPLKLQNFTTPN